MQEHIIVRLLTRIFDFLLLNVLWVLCSIPVISLGASTTALYSVMLKIVEKICIFAAFLPRIVKLGNAR